MNRTCSALIVGLIMMLAVQAVFADYLADITVSQKSPASLPLNWIIEVACDWEWTGDGTKDGPEIHIEAIPMTNGSISPGTYYEGAGPYEPGSGRVWPNFIIQSGDVVVDEILLTMVVSPPDYEVLLELSIPVSLHFGDHAFYGITYDFDSPNRMQFGQHVNVDFIWRTNHPGGHRIMVKPMTNGSYTPGMGALGSYLLTGTSGAASRWFTVFDGESGVDVDALVFELYNDDWSELLYEFIVPADYHFDTTAVQNIVLSPDSPASLAHGENVTITFDYITDYPMDPVMYAVPQTNGIHSPGFIINSAVPLAPGFGSGTNTFSIGASAGLVDVDEILFSMHDFFDENVIIDQFRMPVYYHYSSHAIRNVTYRPEPPAILSNNANAYLDITYFNFYAEDGWLHSTPYSGGVPTPNTDGYVRSVASPGWTSPPATHFITVTTGDELVDKMHFEMFNSTEDLMWLSYFQETWLYFGSSAQLSPVLDVPFMTAPVLHDNYPNPFNPRTTIKFDLPNDMVAGVKIYDLCGRLVKTLVGWRAMTAGEQRVSWDGRDDGGRAVAAGVYLYRLEAGAFSVAKRMTLVK